MTPFARIRTRAAARVAAVVAVAIAFTVFGSAATARAAAEWGEASITGWVAPSDSLAGADAPFPAQTFTVAVAEGEAESNGEPGSALPYCDPVDPGTPGSAGTGAPPSNSADTPQAAPTCIPIGEEDADTEYPSREIASWPWVTVLITAAVGVMVLTVTRVLHAQRRRAALRRLAQRA